MIQKVSRGVVVGCTLIHDVAECDGLINMAHWQYGMAREHGDANSAEMWDYLARRYREARKLF